MATTQDVRCIYCGTSDALTADHVPPQNLFPHPRPSNLITVPACRTCNKSYELDDERFRIFALTQATFDPHWQAFWDLKVKGSSFRRSPKLRQSIADMVTSVELRSKAGLYLGTTEGLAFPAAPIRRVVERIARGLLWHHHQLVPPWTTRFSVMTGIQLGAAALEIVKFLPPGVPARSIGAPVFRYRGGATIDHPDHSLWFLGFYDHLAILVMTDAMAAAEGEPEQ